MQKLFRALFLAAFVVMVSPALAQTTPTFKGAEATLPKYKALYYLNDANPDKIKGTLRNINNALEDERIKGKVEIELVAFGAGYTVFEKTAGYEETLLALQKKGVILAQCSNTIRERKIPIHQLRTKRQWRDHYSPGTRLGDDTSVKMFFGDHYLRSFENFVSI